MFHANLYVAVSRHKIDCYGNVTWPKFIRCLAIGTFSSIVLTQQSTLRFMHPLSTERGDN